MPFIESSVDREILFVSFFDPQSRNSLSLAAAEEIYDVLISHRDSCRAVVFSAKGRVFCSGGNLADYATMDEASQGIQVNRRITEILTCLERYPKPTVCVVQGDCFGGGVELISAFDFVLSAPHPIFGLWQRRIGLSYGWGGGKRLGERMGYARLKTLALSTETFSAAKARELGLVDEIWPETLLEQKAKERAFHLTRLPGAPIAPLKTWRSDNERSLFESLWWNDEHRGVLFQKRKPNK